MTTKTETYLIIAAAAAIMVGLGALAHQSGGAKRTSHPLATLEEEPEYEEPRVVCVEWMDASGDIGWMTKEEYDPAAPIVSCGILVQQDQNYVIIALDWDAEGEHYNQMGSVPLGMVVRIVDMEKGSER